jgi:hypothetical protein
MAASLFGKVAQAGAKAVVNQIAGSGVGAPPPPPPPEKVWCIYLRRNPPLTEEDQPPIGGCEKFCWKLFLIPIAIVTYIIGWFIICMTYLIGSCCLPCLGPEFFKYMVTVRMLKSQGQDKRQQAEQLKRDLQSAFCLVSCLINTAMFTMRDLIRPLIALCDW